MVLASPPAVNVVAIQGPPVWMEVVGAGLIGLLVGSFLNVVIYRVPRALSVFKPRSFCPSCDHQLAWWENIPLLSWTFLRGRCRLCGEHISIRYPIVEAIAGLLFALITWHWRGTGSAAGYCFLAASMLVIVAIELDGRRISGGVAGIGTGGALLLFGTAAAWGGEWRVPVAHLAGTALGGAAAALAIRDGGTADSRAGGGGGLLVAGCWMGGLPVDALVIAAVGGVVAYAATAVGAWALSRQGVPAGSSAVDGHLLRPVLATPLTIALAAAMLASLMVRG